MAPDYDLSTPRDLSGQSLDLPPVRCHLRPDHAWSGRAPGIPLAQADCIVSAVAEKPQAIFNNGKWGADRRARLRKED